MTVEQLIRELQDMPEDAEVRLAQQPSWPFEYSINGVASTEPGEGYEVARITLDDGEQFEAPGWYVLDHEREEDPAGPFETSEEAQRFLEAETHANGENAEPVVYLAEGRQLGYLPGAAARALGWGRS